MLLVLPHPIGESVECGSQGCDLVGEPGEGPAGGCAVAVFLDHGADGGVAVEGGGPDGFGLRPR